MAKASQRKLLFQSPWMKQCSWANKGWALKHFPLVENNFSWNILTLKRKFLCKKLQEMQVQLWHTPNKAFKKANFLSKSYSFPLSHSHITQCQGEFCKNTGHWSALHRRTSISKWGWGGIKKCEQEKTPFFCSSTHLWDLYLLSKHRSYLNDIRVSTFFQCWDEHYWACPRGNSMTITRSLFF